jgi:hypothetical protein
MPESLTERVTELTAEGVYEPGNYASEHDLSAGEFTSEPDGTIWFWVETRTPNTDRERVKVTISPVQA